MGIYLTPEEADLEMSDMVERIKRKTGCEYTLKIDNRRYSLCNGTDHWPSTGWMGRWQMRLCLIVMLHMIEKNQNSANEIIVPDPGESRKEKPVRADETEKSSVYSAFANGNNGV